MVNMVTAMCSYGMLPILLPVMTYVLWGASLKNEWRKLFHRDLPRWLMVDDPSVLAEYYRGEASLYTTRNLTAWLPPLLWWSLVTFVLIFVMLCINIIVRRQWIEHEKLSYPIAEIPLNLVNSNFYSRLMWLGFAIAAGINLINGLHFLHPNLPALAFFKRKYIGYIFTEKPWSALRAMRISFIPSIIGLSFFMPLNLLFSCWFFYFLLARHACFGRNAGLADISGIWSTRLHRPGISWGIPGHSGNRYLAWQTALFSNSQSRV